MLLAPVFLYARTDDTHMHNDSVHAQRDSIYQGMSIKLDLLNSILEPARSKGAIQNYEIAMNWRLIHRLFPTLELGYAQARTEAEGGQHKGQGGFARIGLDLSPLKKHPEYEDLLMVGLRVGTALQTYDLTGVQMHPGYWENTVPATYDFMNQFRCDAWGEVLAGCQVQVYKGLQMGWFIRMKILMTRKAKANGPLPYYIPGFGYRDDTNWGLNYYIGYRF